MVATARLARIRAAGANQVGSSRGKATSSGLSSSPARVRIAAVTGKVTQSGAVVRIGEVAAVAGASATKPAVRVAEVQAFTLAATYTWNGSAWVPATPSGVSIARATSAGSQGNVGGSGQSYAYARSSGSGAAVTTGTLALTGGGTLQLSGVKNPVPLNGVGAISFTGDGTLTLVGSANQGTVPGIFVSTDITNSPPRVVINIAKAGGSGVTVVRIDAAGNQTPVRSANPAVLSAGGWTGFDYEAPYGQPVTYQATSTGGNVFTSAPVTLDPGVSWLIHPGIPDLSCPLRIASIGDRTRDTSAAPHVVLGRRDPIVVSDGQRRSPTFDLMVGIETDDDADALEDLLDDASPLLLQVDKPAGVRNLYRWVSVGAVTESDLMPYLGDAHTTWTLPCTTTTAPAGLLQAQITWADIVAQYATWRDVINAYDTWRDVITGNSN